MSKESHIAKSDNFFIGEDKQLKFTIVDAADAAINVSGYALRWAIGVEGETPILIKTDGFTFEDDAGTNDRIILAIDDVDTDGLSPGRYKHTLWRTDDGLEQVLTYGDAYLRRHPNA